MSNVKCICCGQECFKDQYPEIVFSDENNVICEECSCNYEQGPDGIIKVRADLKDRYSIPINNTNEYDGKTVICYDCGKAFVFDEDDTMLFNKYPLCDDCYDKKYTPCIKCGKVIPYITGYVLNDNEWYCEKCLDKEAYCKTVIIPELRKCGITLDEISEELTYRDNAGIHDDELVVAGMIIYISIQQKN